MSRRREDNLIEDIWDALVVAPSWFGPVFAAVVFVILYLTATLFPSTKPFDIAVFIRPLFAMLSWLFPCLILAMWLFAELWKIVKRMGRR